MTFKPTIPGLITAALALAAASASGAPPTLPLPSPVVPAQDVAAARSAKVNPPPQDPNSDRLIISPAHGWVLPIFNSDGFRTLLLKGNEVQMRRNDQIYLQDVDITLFSGTAQNVATTWIASPEAIYNRAENTASGPSIVRVLRFADNADLSGADWTYEFPKKSRGLKEKLIIRRDARVVLEQQLNDFLQ